MVEFLDENIDEEAERGSSGRLRDRGRSPRPPVACSLKTIRLKTVRSRGGEARAKMIALNRNDPAVVDQRFLDLKPALLEAVRDHKAL